MLPFYHERITFSGYLYLDLWYLIFSVNIWRKFDVNIVNWEPDYCVVNMIIEMSIYILTNLWDRQRRISLQVFVHKSSIENKFAKYWHMIRFIGRWSEYNRISIGIWVICCRRNLRKLSMCIVWSCPMFKNFMWLNGFTLVQSLTQRKTKTLSVYLLLFKQKKKI